MVINSKELGNFILQNSTFASEKTIDVVVKEVEETLKNYNFDLDNIEVKFGETSINFIKDDIVIRLTYIRYDNWGYKSISDYVSHSRAILQPEFEKKIETGDINYPTILGLKTLTIGNVTESERDQVYVNLRNDGYLFNDVDKLENFGKDKQGNIYLLDYGELIYIKDEEKLNDTELYNQIQYKKYIDRELKYHIEKCKRLNNLYEKNKKNIQKVKLNRLKEFIINMKKNLRKSDDDNLNKVK